MTLHVQHLVSNIPCPTSRVQHLVHGMHPMRLNFNPNPNPNPNPNSNPTLTLTLTLTLVTSYVSGPNLYPMRWTVDQINKPRLLLSISTAPSEGFLPLPLPVSSYLYTKVNLTPNPNPHQAKASYLYHYPYPCSYPIHTPLHHPYPSTDRKSVV